MLAQSASFEVALFKNLGIIGGALRVGFAHNPMDKKQACFES
jgi:hypothetical protein